jgi:serine/threonine protein kinase
MELADALAADWKKTPDRGSYVPMDLHKCCEARQGRLLPVSECVRVGVALADALRFLHDHGLTHRDIKPSNVIFVNGQPKLADVGLVRDIRPTDEITSFGGTVGYMPPWPEPPGTPLADIYALGKLLYVISTGNSPGDFPGLPTCLVEQTGHGYILLNSVILKACEADTSKRYASAGDLHAALIDVHRAMPKTIAP